MTGHSLSAPALEHLSSNIVASSGWSDGAQFHLAFAHTSNLNTRHTAASNDFKAGKACSLQIVKMFQLGFCAVFGN